MPRRSRIVRSAAFDVIAHGAQFRDRIAIVVRASPESIFQALHAVRLSDMKPAWLLGEIRYLPLRLGGHGMPAGTAKPFFAMVIGGGTLVLYDDTPREIIIGSAALYHRINQSPRRFASRSEFETITDPDHENLFISIRVTPTGRDREHWLVLERATHALSARSERKFRRYWRLIRPTGAFVSRQLLRAIGRRAESAGRDVALRDALYAALKK